MTVRLVERVGRPLLGSGALARGVDRGMLEQQHGVGHVAGHPGRVQAALLGPRLVVRNEAGVDLHQLGHVSSLRLRR